MWAFIARFILRNRISILIFIGIVTVFMAYIAATRLQLSYKVAKLMPDDDPVAVTYEKFKSHFGLDGNIMVVSIPTDSLYQIDNFKAWKELSEEIRSLTVTTLVKEGAVHKKTELSAIDSVFSEVNLYKLTSNDSTKNFGFSPIIDVFPSTQTELDSVKKEIRSYPFYKGLVYSDTSLGKDIEAVSLMMVFVNNDVFNSKIRGNLIKDFQATIDDFSKEHVELIASGFPYIRVTVTERIKKELNVFVALSILITAFLLFFFFRDLKVVGFSLLVVAIGVVWSLGVIGLFNYEITALLGLLPSLIIVIGVPNCVYLINKYQSECKKEHGNKALSLARVIIKIGNATFLTNLTTSLGFATFIFTQSAILIEFGIVASICILLVFFLSILIIPSLFSFLPAPKAKHTKHLDRKWVNFLMSKLVFIVSHKRKQIYVTALLVVVVGLYGLSLIKVTGSFVDDIPETDVLKENLYTMEKNFNGVMPFEIAIYTNDNGKVTKLSTLEKINKLQDSLKLYNEFSRSLSIVDGVKFSRQAFYKGEELEYAMINKNESSFFSDYISNNSGEFESDNNAKDIASTFIDSTETVARITLQIKDIGTHDMDSIVSSLQRKAENIFNPNRKVIDSLVYSYEIASSQAEKDEVVNFIKLNERKLSRRILKAGMSDSTVINTLKNSLYSIDLTGASVVYVEGTKYLVKNLFTSLLLAICVIAIMMSFLFKSIRMVLISLIPNIVPLIFTSALMGYLGISLKPSTILVFSIAFGISIDDTIHYLAKYRQELKLTNWNIKQSVLNAINETGVSMMYTSIILYFGFGVFMVSDFGGTFALGFLVSITLIVAMFTNLVLLPSLLLSFEKNLTTKNFKDPFVEEPLKEEDIALDTDINEFTNEL